jgi:low affinity Fe/Cu permease
MRKKPENAAFNASFGKSAAKVAQLVGSPFAFIVAVAAVAVWGLVGKHFNYSDTWQLVINTGTTIVTFLMVFLIQNTQNRDARAIHLKLDEIIRAISDADNQMIDVEDLSDSELLTLMKKYSKLRSVYEVRSEKVQEGKKA